MKKRKNFNLILLFVVSAVISSFFFSFGDKKEASTISGIDTKHVERVLKKTVAACKNDRDCYYKKFYDITLKYDYAFSFAALDRLTQQKPEYSYCHFFAHSIGHGAYAKNPSSWQNTLNNISQSCSYGAFHGVIEQYASGLDMKNKSITDRDVLQGICEGKMGSCPHILGHIILVYEEADTEKAIHTCGAFTDEAYTWCLNGIFMEYVYPKTLVEHKLVDGSRLDTIGKLPELRSFCDSFSDPTVSSVCWGELAQATLKEYRGNSTQMLDFCQTASLPLQQKACENRTIDVLATSQNFDILRLKSICRSYPDRTEWEKDCYVRLIGRKITNEFKIDSNSSTEFCLSLDKNYQQSCFQQVGSALQRRNEPEQTINIVCQNAPGQYMNDCRKKEVRSPHTIL